MPHRFPLYGTVPRHGTDEIYGIQYPVPAYIQDDPPRYSQIKSSNVRDLESQQHLYVADDDNTASAVFCWIIVVSTVLAIFILGIILNQQLQI